MTFQHKRKCHEEGPVEYKRHERKWGNMVKVTGLRHNKGIGVRDINGWSAKIKNIYVNTHFVIWLKYIHTHVYICILKGSLSINTLHW